MKILKALGVIAVVLLILSVWFYNQLPVGIKSREAIIKYVNGGSDPNLSFTVLGNPKSERRLIHQAVRNMDPALLKFLVSKGADPNATDYMGQTALMTVFGGLDRIETESKAGEAMIRFLAPITDYSKKGIWGDTVLDVAKEFSSKEYLELLIELENKTAEQGAGQQPPASSESKPE